MPRRILPLLLPACLAAFAATAAAEPAVPDEARQRELVHIVRQDCGSCHGLTLQGGLGSPLIPENLRDKPVDGLVATIVGGRPGTPMPPFRGLVTEAEAKWIVERLLEGFPADPGALPLARSTDHR